MNEEKFQVTFDVTGVAVVDPNGRRTHVSWATVREVVVFTTDGGPFEADFWIGFMSDEGDCGFPSGATGAGSDTLFSAFKRFPGFDHGAFASACGSVENKKFVAWRRPC